MTAEQCEEIFALFPSPFGVMEFERSKQQPAISLIRFVSVPFRGNGI